MRTRFMEWLYETSDGNEVATVEEKAFVDETGVGERELENAIRYLEGEGLLRAHWSLGGILPGGVSITHLGVREIEEALTRPAHPTEHFVPMMNITTVHGNVVGSQIQQGSPGASQEGALDVSGLQEIQDIVRATREALPNLDLSNEERFDLEKDLDMVEREISRARPRQGLIREILTSVRTVVEAAAGNVAAQGILALPWPS